MDKRERPSDVLRTIGMTREEPSHSGPNMCVRKSPRNQWTLSDQKSEQDYKCCCHATGPWATDIKFALPESGLLKGPACSNRLGIERALYAVPAAKLPS